MRSTPDALHLGTLIGFAKIWIYLKFSQVPQKMMQLQNFLQKYESISKFHKCHKKWCDYKIFCKNKSLSQSFSSATKNDATRNFFAKIWVYIKVSQVPQKMMQLKIFLLKHESISKFLKCHKKKFCNYRIFCQNMSLYQSFSSTSQILLPSIPLDF